MPFIYGLRLSLEITATKKSRKRNEVVPHFRHELLVEDRTGALRDLGDRNIYEFTLSKSSGLQKVGDVQVALRKTDVKRNRYTVDVLADDKQVEKKDKDTNEPVQFYASGARQPYELVINQVKKDQVTGYLATPKVTVSRISVTADTAATPRQQ